MKRAVVVLLLLIANAVFGNSRDAALDSPAGKLFAEWLAAYNAADGAALRKFAETRYTPEARQGRTASDIAEGQLESREASGGYDVADAQNADGTLAVTLKSRGSFTRFVKLSLKVNDAQLITERKVSGAAPPSDTAWRRPADELAKELDGKLEELRAKDQFSGVALIAKDGKPVWQKTYGMQDREQQILINLDTRFRLGSMNKMFTSVAIAQLVEAGKFKFTDTVAAVLPDYPNKEIAEKITVEQLLTHSSGLGDIFTPAFAEKRESLRELRDYLPLFVDQALRFEPGKGRSYSNAGFIVLGLIVEKHSGKSYYDFVQERIYDVAGMSSTSSIPFKERPPNIAVGYMRGADGKLMPNWGTMPYRGMSAGGGESTAGDLLRFANALRGYKLLSPEMTELITSGKPEPDGSGPSSYAYGFADRKAGARRIVGHNGGAPGMNADLSILWNEGYTVAVLANVDPTVAQDAAEYAANRLL